MSVEDAALAGCTWVEPSFYAGHHVDRLGGDIEQHPLPLLLDAGIRCSINGDDPLLFGPGILEEYQLCRDVLGVNDDQLADIARASLEGSGAPPEVIAAAVADIDAWAGVPA